MRAAQTQRTVGPMQPRPDKPASQRSLRIKRSPEVMQDSLIPASQDAVYVSHELAVTATGLPGSCVHTVMQAHCVPGPPVKVAVFA